MDFGKLSDLSGVNWDLPPEDPLSLSYLRGLARQPVKFYIGAPAWGHRSWIGKIYPPGTKATDFLRHYACSFNCIELNTSHYRIPTVEQVQKWREQVSPGFRFCPKVVQTVSHTENGLLDRRTQGEWMRFLNHVGENLGPSFLQLPPYFDYLKKAQLFHFLQNWSDEFPLALEFRHPSWFPDGRLLPALTEYLQKRRIGMVISDTSGRRDVLHSTVSGPFTFIRFVGNMLHPTDGARIADWTRRLLKWQEAGIQEVYFIVHQPDDELAPETAKLVLENWTSQSLANLPEIQFYQPNTLSFPLD